MKDTLKAKEACPRRRTFLGASGETSELKWPSKTRQPSPSPSSLLCRSSAVLLPPRAASVSVLNALMQPASRRLKISSSNTRSTPGSENAAHPIQHMTILLLQRLSPGDLATCDNETRSGYDHQSKKAHLPPESARIVESSSETKS